MADNTNPGHEVGTEVPGGLFVGGVFIAFVMIAIIVYTHVHW